MSVVFLDSGASPRGDLSPRSVPGSTGEALHGLSLPATADLLLKEMLLFPQAWVTSVLPVTSLPLLPNTPSPPASALHVKHRVPGRPAKAFSGPVRSQGPCKAWIAGKNKGDTGTAPLVLSTQGPLPAPRAPMSPCRLA